jgi:hypothetical protein
VALCREVGINANLVLISTRNYGNKTMPLPAIDFNHCIAQLNLGEKIYYLELTDNTLPFAAALVTDLTSEILPIPFSDESFGDKLLTMEMPFRHKNLIKRFHNISISNNDMHIIRHSVYLAAVASSLRSSYRDIGSEDQQKQISQAIATDFTVPIKVTDLKFNNLDNLEDSMTIDYKIEVKNALQDVAGIKILKLPWTDKISSLDVVTAESRKYPLEFWSYLFEDMSTEEINITLPQGKKFIEIPQDVRLECANANYQLTFKAKTPGRVIVRRSFQRKTEQISPDEYKVFRDFLIRVSECDNKQYAIK